MTALIVTADDFAFSPEVTAGICEARRRGVVTEASMLIFSPWAAEALARAGDVALPVGLHLDLVSPFVESRGPLLGPRGRFCIELLGREFEHRVDQLFSCADLFTIRDEMRHQVEEFVRLAGHLPSHISYHYGLHYLGDVMAMYLIVAEQYDLPVRWGRQYAGSNPYPLAPACLCDTFRGRAEDGLALFLQAADQPCPGIQEIICHPGYGTPGMVVDSYNGERERELRTLTEPRLQEERERREIQLVTFAWLRQHAGATPNPERDE